MKISISFLLLGLWLDLSWAGIPCDLVRKDPAYVVGHLKSSKGFCSGVLLSPHLVLTAAHCTHEETESHLEFSLTVVGSGKKSGVSKVLPHPSYWRDRQGVSGGLDLSILVLGNTGYGSVPEYFFPVFGEGGLRTGEVLTSWGFGLQDDGMYARRRKKSVVFVKMEDSNLSSSSILKDARMILRRGESGELQCSGDSGGPVFLEKAGQLWLVGINSRSAANISYTSKDSLKRKLASKEYFCQHSEKFISSNVAVASSWIAEMIQKFEIQNAKPRCQP